MSIPVLKIFDCYSRQLCHLTNQKAKFSNETFLSSFDPGLGISSNISWHFFDNGTCERPTKTSLYKGFEPIHVELNNNDVTYYIFGGGFHLYSVIWQKDVAFGSVFD